MKTIKNFKKKLLITNLLIFSGALTFLLSGFVAEKDSFEEAGEVKTKEEVKTWRWEEMFPSDMREALEEMPIAWVLFSPLEWHGEAMSFGTDPMIGQHILDKAWKQVGGVRIPTVYVGVETDFK